MSDKNGGPAFPTLVEHDQHGQLLNPASPGMLLRDYFAAKALQGWLAGPCDGENLAVFDDLSSPDIRRSFKEHQEAVAKACYGYADAMLAARESK